MTTPPGANTNLPDFSAEGYQVLRELGHNRAGGRITYLAQEFNTSRLVVIKQFQFATERNRWEEYDACQQEIHILKSLDHPQIPRYLDSFHTATGFCMVQEYKEAPSLADPRLWSPAQVRQIAISVLEILTYLQQRIPPIIHRDLKPENILVDDRLTVYLVDFGFARLGGGQVAVSSVVKGTLGFMPPEQLFNRELTQASDLYSLGITLLCLLTQVSSTEVGLLMNEAGQVQIRSRLSHLSPAFLTWLETITQPQAQQRYANAPEALRHLMQIRQLRQSPLARLQPLRFLAWGTVVGTGVALLAISLLPPLRDAVRQALEPRFLVLLSSLQSWRAEELVSYPEASPPGGLGAEADFQVTLTRDLNANQKPVDQLTSVSSDEPWVAYVEASNLADGDHQVTCELLDESGAVINAFRRESTLWVEQQQLSFWCRYGREPLSEGNPNKRPYWFQLRLAGKPVAKWALQAETD